MDSHLNLLPYLHIKQKKQLPYGQLFFLELMKFKETLFFVICISIDILFEFYQILIFLNNSGQRYPTASTTTK